MHEPVWGSWGATVIGPLHVKAHLPNQDAWMARRYQWGNVIVVADGLGSKAHSAHGAKAACLAIFDAARHYQRFPAAPVHDILRLAHAYWLVRIAPFSAAECATTCLFAIQTADLITLGRLGDGMISVLAVKDNDDFLLADDKQGSFSNYTTSLRSEFKPEQWDVTTVAAFAVNAVMLCTDGISDDLRPGSERAFSRELHSAYLDVANAARRKDLRRWLTDWPVPGHTDDKTIACLFRKGVSR
ncbi:PP2C family serine/threonine-protein phosphatase [Yersinia enterocolitica]